MASDGQWIPIRYSLQKKSGDSHVVRTGIITAGVAVFAWPVAPAFLLMKGKDVTINKGVTFDIYTDSPHVIAAASPAPAVLVAQTTTPAPALNTPEAGSATGSASVTITAPVGAAEIEVDGAFVGNTPTTVQLSSGIHQIAVRSGNQTWTRKLQVTAGSNVSLSAALSASTLVGQ
jgi:hypothetical protein